MTETLIAVGSIGYGFGLETEGRYISMNVYFAGCSKEPKCEGCHNPGLWEVDKVILMKVSEFRDMIERDLPLIKAIVIMGGEPLDQPEGLLVLCDIARDKGLCIYLYSGMEIQDIHPLILDRVDVLVAGPYIQALAEPGAWPASTNQTVYRMSR
ncbi:MAG: 4Fe-4S cluster-binding domain-containing protein [Candidatus Omnitrophica bacterium]|nr:4Fe-4S cluster-binding domain-containing protein [Candidatus Omnitrophota bacterium]